MTPCSPIYEAEPAPTTCDCRLLALTPAWISHDDPIRDAISSCRSLPVTVTDWDEEDVWFYFKVDSERWVTRQVELRRLFSSASMSSRAHDCGGLLVKAAAVSDSRWLVIWTTGIILL